MSKTPRTDEAQCMFGGPFPTTTKVYEDCLEWAQKLERENADLRHDIARHVQIAADQANELADLRARLEQADRPAYIAGLKRAAEICDDYGTREGCITGIRAEADRLNGESK